MCVSDDAQVVGRLVALLRKHWDVWWSEDISHGDWEEQVRLQIAISRAVLPVLSASARGERASILKDEMRYAKSKGKPILPFLIEGNDVPLGFGGLNHTPADGWKGQEGHEAYRMLKTKLQATIGTGRSNDGYLERPKSITIREKSLTLPAFVFSLSSHETQVSPIEGASLLQFLEPRAILVSAYDAWNLYRRNASFYATMKAFVASDNVVFLDSGNYEAYRLGNRYTPRRNPSGWRKENFWKVATRLSPDAAFAFDSLNPKGEPDEVVFRIAKRFRADDKMLQERDFPLCPIVHLPTTGEDELASVAAHIVSQVAKELDPLLIAIPERELGDGLLARVRSVRTIRKALDGLNRYYPLHLLGTGNPLSMVALAAAGADLFDGLEWCRTVADYDNGYLFHFQHFDFFIETRANRIQDPRVRRILEDPDASYAMKALSYNVDYFKDTTRTMQGLIHSDQAKVLLRMVPNIGTEVFTAISE